MDSIISVLANIGGIGVALWVLKLFIDGKIHSQSEMDIVQHRVDDLLGSVKALTTALDSSNQQSSTIISLFKTLQSEDTEQ
jgi:hypothetical protein